MSKSVNAEIIAVGSELLLGQIANTNAQWISKKLADIGVNVYYHHTVGDNAQRLEKVFRLAQERSNLVIVTGGLGPTDDDLTRDVAAKVLNQSLILDTAVLNEIEQFFIRRNIVMTENNRKQALVLQNSKVFYNQEGMAPGMFLEYKQTGWVFLPGVPREMKSLMEEQIIPFLQNYYQLDEMIISKVLKFIGIGESLLEDKLADLIQNQTNPTIAPLAKEGEVTLRLTAKSKSKEAGLKQIEELEKQILARVGTYFYGYDEKSIEEKVFKLLQQNNWTISSAESLTGGSFIEKMISIPGASNVVCGSIVSYQTETKIDVLGVPKEIINKYGTISEQCAEEMAVQIQRKMASNIGISFTGNAGPEAVEGKPNGTVYIGVKMNNNEAQVFSVHFNGSRKTVRERAVKKGYELLYKYLSSFPNKLD
jgi:nicotinamide-nucleotide amidase